jgi:4-hydroxy-4-methyl-2-oxoglutarate aldolase
MNWAAFPYLHAVLAQRTAWAAWPWRSVPVCVFGVTVMPGDFVVCDADGAAIVPRDRAEEIIAKAREKAAIENSARDLLLAGGYLRDVWEKYRVL